jgi:hypothetical protein
VRLSWASEHTHVVREAEGVARQGEADANIELQEPTMERVNE